MQIRVLGEVRVVGTDPDTSGDDETADRTIGRGQAREVLAVLAVHRGRPLDTDELARSLWDDDRPRTASTIVHGAVARLRRALGDTAIVRCDAGYQLDGSTDVDLWELQDLVEEGRIAEARARLATPILGPYQDRPWAVGLVADLVGLLGRPADPVAASGRLRPSPAPVTRLVGRRRELQALREAVRRSRLVTLVGLGGIGKSRLAAELLVDPTVSDGARVVRADLGQAPGAFSARLTAELGVATLAASDGMAATASVLTGPPTILLLDGCEHDLEGAADAAAYLLGRCSSLRIVATSRVALGAPGEHVVPVLPFADPGNPLGDAADLLLDRARALGFSIDHDDRALAAAICQRCAGVPLAIEMASTQLLTGSSLADFGSGLPVVTPAAAMRDGITAAAGTLGPATELAARRASLLPAGLNTSLLDQLADGRGALVARELLAAGIATTEGTGQGRRLRFPDPIREHLVDGADAGDATLVAARLAAVGNRCRVGVLDPVDLGALASAIAEIANAAALLEVLTVAGLDDRRLELALAFATAWREDGHWNAGSAELKAALAAAEQSGSLDPAIRAEVVWAIVTVGGTFELSARWADTLRTAAEDALAADRPELAVALRVREANGLGYIGRLADASQAVAAARDAATRSGSQYANLYVDALEATGRMLAGQPERAGAELAAIGAIATGYGAHSEAARAHRLASMAARTAGDLELALTQAEIAEEQALVGLCRGTLAVVRGDIADLRFSLDPASARPALLMALETGSAAGEVRLAGVSRLRLGLLEGDRATVAAAAVELMGIDGWWASLALAHLYGQVPARHPLRRLVPVVLGRLEWGAPLSPADEALVAAVPHKTGKPPATWQQDLLEVLVSVR